MTLHLLDWAAFLPFFTWLVAASMCRAARANGRDPGILNTIRAELHPFRYALAIADFVCSTAVRGPDFLTGGLLALNLYWCWSHRRDNDDDDRWKRRKDAAAGYVREVAGRLVVTPEPA